MTRVLSVVGYPLGGIRTHLLYTYPLLAESGYSFSFVLPDTDASKYFQEEIRSWRDVEVIVSPMVGKHRSRFWFVPTVRRLLRQRRFALIHSHGMQTISQVVVANLGLGIPHVATSHDMVRPECFPGISGRMKLAVLNGIVSQLDTLITVSHAARINHIESLPWLRRLNRPVVPIVNGIDARRFDPAEIAVDLPFRSRLGIPDDVFLAGFLGRFMELKGFMVLVDAMEILAREDRIPPIHVVAVGSGDYVREYRRDVERRPNVRDRITFLPHVADVAPTLQQLDLLVMPSLREACGILAMEAMAVGTPVLGTSCAGLAEVLRDTPSRVVPPSDANALARAIRDEMASPSKQQAREYAVLARQRFDVRHVAAALRHIFDQFSGQSSTTALSKASSHALSPQVDPYA